MIEAVIFDMGGVILDSESSIREAEVKTFKQFGVPATMELVSEYTGFRFDQEIEDISRRFGVNLSLEDVTRAHDQNMEYYYRQVVPLVPYSRETLKILRPLYALGLATMKDKRIASLALEKLDLLSFFKALTFGEDVIKGKPDPEAFLRTAKLLDIDPSRCAVVEDSNPGFRGGKAAGMLVLARRAEHNIGTDFSPADFIVDDLREIPRILTSTSR